MSDKDAVGFLPSDEVVCDGSSCIIPLHVARDIVALLNRLGKDAEYYASLLRDSYAFYDSSYYKGLRNLELLKARMPPPPSGGFVL